MLRTHTCGELKFNNIQEEVTLCGCVQGIRDKGGVLWIDLRDRYGITRLLFDEGKCGEDVINRVRSLEREHVVLATGVVKERLSKNDKIPNGAIEITVSALEVLSPLFLTEDETDGDLRIKYRYLDLHRNVVRENLLLRHRVATHSRAYPSSLSFIRVETPIQMKSTPAGARDFVVPSHMNPEGFYALPPSPPTFKQLLLVSGFDRCS